MSQLSAILRFLIAFAAGIAMLTGCHAEKAVAIRRLPGGEDRYADAAQRLRSDPLGFLKELQDRTNALTQYRVTFYRQERLGFVPRLGHMEKIPALFRKQPFSVKFEWDDPDEDFYESVYVAGQNRNQLVIRERKGFLTFPPQVRLVDVTAPVLWGRAKNPITDFGLAALVRRTLMPIEDPQLAPRTTMNYEGIVALDLRNRPAHHLRIQHPATPRFPYTRHDFYIDASTLLPAGTDLWLADGRLDARYRYLDVDTTVQLTDADFRLRRDHPTTQPQ